MFLCNPAIQTHTNAICLCVCEYAQPAQFCADSDNICSATQQKQDDCKLPTYAFIAWE